MILELFIKYEIFIQLSTGVIFLISLFFVEKNIFILLLCSLSYAILFSCTLLNCIAKGF